jgi:hypothetical protein
MKNIIIDDINITWNSDKTFNDISDLILIYLYGNKNAIKKDKESIERRKERLNKKLNKLCKVCGNPLDIDDYIRCKQCKLNEKQRYIPIRKRIFRSKKGIDYSWIYLKNYIKKCEHNNNCNYELCLNCDYLE